MKNFLLIAAAAIGVSAAAQAQTTIYASYGGYTQMDACNNHDDWANVHTAWGAVNAGFDFHVAPKFSIGPSYTFSSCCTDGGQLASHIAYHAVLLNAKYDYYRSGMWSLYGHLGAGVVISHMQPKFFESYNKVYFAGQISPLGVRAALSSNFNMFAEVGFGAQGVAQVGFSLDL